MALRVPLVFRQMLSTRKYSNTGAGDVGSVALRSWRSLFCLLFHVTVGDRFYWFGKHGIANGSQSSKERSKGDGV